MISVSKKLHDHLVRTSHRKPQTDDFISESNTGLDKYVGDGPIYLIIQALIPCVTTSMDTDTIMGQIELDF